MSNTTANMTSHSIDPLDEPPPYTPRADPLQGETTVEYGPSRAFQQVPHRAPQQPPQPRPNQTTYLSPQPTSASNRGRGILQQLSESIDQIANQIERHTTGVGNRQYVYPQRTGTSWSSYPGTTRASSSRRVPSPVSSSSTRSPPPLPPRRQRSSSLSNPANPESSDFARDFYAAGTGGELVSEGNGGQGSQTQNNTSPPQRSPDNGGPTTTPVPGRPLLHDGQLLVYPKGYSCEKCHNTGYKHYDPIRPCRKCWTKYGKPFSGPLAYSYSSSSTTSNTQNINLQKPLPQHIGGPPRRQVPALPPRPNLNGYHSAPPHRSYDRGQSVPFISPGYGAPPHNAVVYRPGDPRIGGNRCWSCGGKGTVNVVIDNINCPVCGGCGRTFGSMF